MIYLFEADYGYTGKRLYLVMGQSRYEAQALLEKKHPILRNIELTESFNYVITSVEED